MDELKQMLGPRLIEVRRKKHVGGNDRVFARVYADGIRDAARAVIEKGGRLSTISCVEHRSFFELLYHFSMDSEGYVLTLVTEIPKELAEVDSISTVTLGAAFIEREISDLFGVKFRGHPDPRRLVLPDDWEEGCPLRKEWKREWKE